MTNSLLLKMVIYSGFSHWKWRFSIAMLVYQRVYPSILPHHWIVNHALDALGCTRLFQRSPNVQTRCKVLYYACAVKDVLIALCGAYWAMAVCTEAAKLASELWGSAMAEPCYFADNTRTAVALEGEQLRFVFEADVIVGKDICDPTTCTTLSVATHALTAMFQNGECSWWVWKIDQFLQMSTDHVLDLIN